MDTLVLTLLEDSLNLTVETMTHKLEHDICVGVYTWVLSVRHQLMEHVLNVCYMEVTAEGKVLRSPVVTAKEWMHILHAGLSSSRITQVAHVELTGEAKMAICVVGVVLHLLWMRSNTLVCQVKYLGNRARALCSLTEHVILTWRCLQLYTSDTRTLLATVILFVHQKE